MNDTIFMFSEAFILGMLILSLRKGALCPFPDVAIVYLAFLELVLSLQVNGTIDYRFLESYSSYSFEKNYGTISIFICLYAAALTYAKVKSDSKINYKLIFSRIHIPGGAVWGLAIFFYLYLFAFLLNMNPSEVWMNDTYLLMGSPDIMLQDTILTKELLLLIVPVSLLSSILFFLLYLKGDRAYFLYLPIFLWWLLYEIGAHSRVAALMLGVGMFLALFLGRRGIASVLTVLAFVCSTQALSGRGGDFHGLSQVGNAFTLAYKGITENFDQTIANAGEGIFVSSEALTFHPNLSTSYMLLSFSPLVNAIDGYQDVYARDGVRLSAFVPMSSVGELVAFGIPYLILYVIVQVFAGRATTKLISRKPGLLAVFLNVAIMFGFMQQFAYPLRTCFRWFVFPVLICFFV